MEVVLPYFCLTVAGTEGTKPLPAEITTSEHWKNPYVVRSVDWNNDIEVSDTAIKTLVSQLKVLLKSVRLEKIATTAFEDKKEARRHSVAILSDVDANLAAKLDAIEQNPYEAYAVKFRKLNLSAQEKQALVDSDKRYLALVNITARDKIIEILVNPATNLRDMQQTVNKYKEDILLPQFTPKNLLEDDQRLLRRKDRLVLRSINNYMKGRHKDEELKRATMLSTTFSPAQAKFSEKIQQLGLEIEKNEATLKQQKKEAGILNADGDAIIPAPPTPPEIVTATDALSELKIKHAVALAVNEQLSTFYKQYISDHTLSITDFKTNCNDLLGDEGKVTIKIENADNVLEDTEVKVKEILCQQRDEWSFKGVMEYLLKSIGWESGARFFQPDSAGKLDKIEASVNRLPAGPGLRGGDDGE